MSDTKYSIYMIEHKSRDIRYIGITGVSIARRMSAHQCRMRTGSTTSRLYTALRKYGWDNFDVTVIDSARTLKQAAGLEQLYIPLYNGNLNTVHAT